MLALWLWLRDSCGMCTSHGFMFNHGLTFQLRKGFAPANVTFSEYL